MTCDLDYIVRTELRNRVMGIITVKHYQASKLPHDLRGDLPSDAIVSVTIQEEQKKAPPSTPEALKKQIENAQRGQKRPVTIEEAVERIRKLRDEWDS